MNRDKRAQHLLGKRARRIHLIALRQAVNLAQKAVHWYVPKETSLVEALIRERREEAGRE
jgi:hypothetical protein